MPAYTQQIAVFSAEHIGIEASEPTVEYDRFIALPSDIYTKICQNSQKEYHAISHSYPFMQGGQHENILDQFNANTPFAIKTKELALKHI